MCFVFLYLFQSLQGTSFRWIHSFIRSLTRCRFSRSLLVCLYSYLYLIFFIMSWFHFPTFPNFPSHNHDHNPPPGHHHTSIAAASSTVLASSIISSTSSIASTFVPTSTLASVNSAASISTTSSATSMATNTISSSYCDTICSSLQFSNQTVSVNSCGYYNAGSTVNITGGQSVCGSSAYPQVDLCRVALSVTTSDTSENYMEVWLPTGWNGRFLATDNKGLAGCKSSYCKRTNVTTMLMT